VALPGERFDGIVVTNYLHRPLLPDAGRFARARRRAVYETFARGNERFGKPSNPAFLLAPGELLEAVGGRLRCSPTRTWWWTSPRPRRSSAFAPPRE
jgi:hypothetical protein